MRLTNGHTQELEAREREREEPLADVVEMAEDRGLDVGALTFLLMGGCRMTV